MRYILINTWGFIPIKPQQGVHIMASKAAPAKKVVAKKAAPKKASAITTKSQILAALAANGEISKKQASTVYDVLLAIAYVGAKQPKGIVLPGLGKLIKVKRPARMGRNPATGATIKIPAKTVVKFRVAKAAKDMILK
jgi:DNA-binding protein HU-beta